jgi:hypothetical protein
MAMNTAPVFTLTPHTAWSTITTADTTLDGTGANVVSIFTAGANGSFIQSIVVKSNTTTTTAATSFCVYLNNGSTNTSAINNTLIKEFTLGAVTASNVAASLNWEFPMNIQIPSSYVIMISIGTVNASTGFATTVVGADY